MRLEGGVGDQNKARVHSNCTRLEWERERLHLEVIMAPQTGSQKAGIDDPARRQSRAAWLDDVHQAHKAYLST